MEDNESIPHYCSFDFSKDSVVDIDFNETEERFVAFLDIMGFKDRVARNGHEVVLQQLEEFQTIISQCFEEYEKSSIIRYAMFSDSIILFSRDSTENSLKAIAEITSKIMASAMHQKTPIPLKGAIALGTVTCDMAKQLYFGQAIIDAYLLEEDIKYYGVLVHHSAEKMVRDLKSYLFRNVKAVLKSGSIWHYELNWYDVTLNDDKSKSTLKECLDNLRLTVSDEPRKYIDNTLVVIESVRRSD